MVFSRTLTTISRVPHMLHLLHANPAKPARALVARAACALLTLAALSHAIIPARAAGMCDGMDTVPLASARLRAQRDDATALLCRARAYAAQRDLARALADLNRAAALRPQDADIYAERARLLTQRNDADGAMADYDRAIALKPTARALSERGMLHARAGDLDAALRDVDAAIVQQPTSSGLYVLRGELRERQGALQAEPAPVFGGPALSLTSPRATSAKLALADFEFALKLDQDASGAYLGLARVQRDLARTSLDRSPERFANAIANADAALARAPDRFDAWMLKAELFVLGEDRYNAQRLLLRIIERFPKRAEPHVVRARLALEQRFWTAALDSASAALALDKTSAEAHCARGNALVALGQRAKSRAAYERCAALSKDPAIAAWAADGLKPVDVAR
jgi:tetratricopeptide (TPR) repeat protein